MSFYSVRLECSPFLGILCKIIARKFLISISLDRVVLRENQYPSYTKSKKKRTCRVSEKELFEERGNGLKQWESRQEDVEVVNGKTYVRILKSLSHSFWCEKVREIVKLYRKVGWNC